MHVRGAPAIGATGAFGMCLSAFTSGATESQQLVGELKQAKQVLDGARPTAVNLSWATAQMVALAEKLTEDCAEITVDQLRTVLLAEGTHIATEDVKINKRMAATGVEVVPSRSRILHHCNTGSLATVYYGTALGVIFEAAVQGKCPFVYVDETRPRLQGAKLTAYELLERKIDMKLIADSAAGYLMYTNKVDLCLVGADRVCANGDVANKIGTYKVAVCAKENGVPFYPVVPTSTIDLSLKHGSEIVVEERSSEEVTKIEGTWIAPVNCPVFNPAFDITPHRYVTGIITEEGICYPPFNLSLRKAKLAAEERLAVERDQRLRALIESLGLSHT